MAILRLAGIGVRSISARTDIGICRQFDVVARACSSIEQAAGSYEGRECIGAEHGIVCRLSQNPKHQIRARVSTASDFRSASRDTRQTRRAGECA